MAEAGCGLAADLRAKIGIQQTLIVIGSVNIDMTLHACELRAYPGVLCLVKWRYTMALHAKTVAGLCKQTVVWTSVRAVAGDTPLAARIV